MVMRQQIITKVVIMGDVQMGVNGSTSSGFDKKHGGGGGGGGGKERKQENGGASKCRGQ